MTKSDALYYLPLGGAGEIGMNLYLYGYGAPQDRRWIMVDCGIGFPDGEFSPGVEVMLPDVEFLEHQRRRLEGIFITHAHEDHVGAVGHLWRKFKAPIYATPFVAAIAKRKMQEAGLDPNFVRVVEVGGSVEAGPFGVEFFPMTHSIPQTSALILRVGGLTVFHTADFKLEADPILGDPVDEAALERLGKEGVDVLVCDSTNIFNPGSAGGEIDIAEALKAAIMGCEGRVAATTFASNVGRLKTLAEAAVAAEREVVLAGRAMRRMIEAAVETGVLTSFPKVLPEERIDSMPDRHLFFLLTGSQGEGRAAMAKVASGAHPTVELGEGDLAIFSSSTIPGNEPDVARIHNMLSERGVRIIDGDREPIHVSGHACQDELERVYRLLRPKTAVPMHGEHRHLVEHCRRAAEWGAKHALLAVNGSLCRLAPGAPKMVEEVVSGRIYVDGKVLIGALDGVVRARRKTALSGHISIALIVDETGDLIADPELRILGAPEYDASWQGPLETLAAEAVDAAFERLTPKAKLSDAAIEEAAGIAARRVCMQLWGKKPETTVIVVRLDEGD